MRTTLIIMMHLILSCCLLNAVQGSTNPHAGSISGKVVDSAGSAIPGARITIIKLSNENHFETVTDCGGTYQTSVVDASAALVDDVRSRRWAGDKQHRF